ncbi:proline-, glutamic acid- and leucine-rich protein 1 isoform X2 [Scaptodrosophila lebanonensis]|nr:proline-, glutamic acid- and leucine-rich protein 1 isoform X2 [Scaptodrosophila lebanonensis]
MQVVPERSKTFASVHILKLLQSFSLIEKNGNNRSIVPALKALKQCLKQYPATSKTHRTLVACFLKSLLDNNDINVIYESGLCWALLHHQRGGRTGKILWQQYHFGLLDSLHNLLDQAFPKYSDFYKGQTTNEYFDYFALKVEADPIRGTTQMCRRFSNLTEFLKISLSEPFSSKKQIYPRKILSIVERGLGLTSITLKANLNTENLFLEAVLPHMCIKVLELLEIFMKISHTHIRMHFRLILFHLLELLKWTRSPLSGNQKLIVALRSKTYIVISLWCSILQDGSHCDILSEHLLQEIYDDIVPREIHISLSASTKGGNKNQNKCTQNNSILCEQALRCLQNFFVAARHTINHSIIKNVHSKILTICVQMYGLKDDHLYNNWRCRLEIYNMVYVLMMHFNQHCTPTNEVALHVFATAWVNDKNIHIRNICQSITQTLDKRLHPDKDCFTFPKGHKDFEIYNDLNSNINNSTISEVKINPGNTGKNIEIIEYTNYIETNTRGQIEHLDNHNENSNNIKQTSEVSDIQHISKDILSPRKNTSLKELDQIINPDHQSKCMVRSKFADRDESGSIFTEQRICNNDIDFIGQLEAAFNDQLK